MKIIKSSLSSLKIIDMNKETEMKDLETIIKNYKSDCLDGRDISRLAMFIPEERLEEIGVELKEKYKGKHKAIPFTRENVLEQLKDDLDFAFEKALDRRGISASLMFDVIKMWNWILEEGLEDWSDNDYAQYGLPLFKATAVKYGFDNPIGDDYGNEYKYSQEAEYEQGWWY